MTTTWFRRAAAGAVVALASASLLVVAAGPASAAVSNDTSDGAIEITALPFTAAVDVTSATTDAQDAQANASCGIEATDNSIWYTYTPSADTNVLIDVGGSDFLAGVIVATGTPGDLTTQACWAYNSTIQLTGGTTYYLLAFADTPQGSPGGTLRISVEAVSPPPTLDVVVAPTGTVDIRSGIATVHGTLACTDANYAELHGQLTQRVGQLDISGYLRVVADVVCDGSPHAWQATATPFYGKFAGGKAVAVTNAFACNDYDCVSVAGQSTVQLRGGTTR